MIINDLSLAEGCATVPALIFKANDLPTLLAPEN